MGDWRGPIRIGIDTGGTFTDFVVARGRRFLAFKVPSTPHDPAEAILSGIARALSQAVASEIDIVHGTTVATNALLERKGARTALITTDGFQDVIEIGRQARPQLYNLMVTRPEPLVPRELRFGARERIAPDGSVIVPLDEGHLANIVEQIAKSGVESVAVSLLFSFANPRHEQLIARAMENTGLPVSLSHRILPEYREYERTSTVVINAYLMPLMSRYLGSLEERLRGSLGARGRSDSMRLRIMQSNGGSISAEAARREPVRAILSGPAGGVVGALSICKLLGIRDIITFDMGGTSTDVSLCRGQAQTTNEATVAGLPIAIPIIDIHTVGAGGGSIARLDQGGALRVGPESAGADPGPACYGRGEEVTVTDANLVLGRLGGTSLLGGQIRLDLERATFYVQKLADQMSRFLQRRVAVEEAALGVVRVANANMERALRAVSIERGRDPRLFTLVCFGGAGGLHACELAAALRIPKIIVPHSPGTLSALGVLLGNVIKDYSRTVMMRVDGLDLDKLEREFTDLERMALRDLEAEGFGRGGIKLIRSVAMRYVGQSFEIEIKWGRRFHSEFHAAHRERYGFADASRPTEIVSIRVRGVGLTEKPRLSRLRATRARKVEPHSIARVYFAPRPIATPVYQRERLSPGSKLSGPAIISEYGSTTLIPPGHRVRVDEWLNLIIVNPSSGAAHIAAGAEIVDNDARVSHERHDRALCHAGI
jgi:N-methylhydantoinase A